MKAINALLLLAFFAVVAANVDINDFFPFGVDDGDQYLAPGDDTSSAEQPISQTFSLFTYAHNSLWVNVNGAISFVQPIQTYTPSCAPVDSNYQMISPFWADVDTQSEPPTPYSSISFRESRDPAVLQQARAEILNAFKNLTDITITWAYIVTYNNVTYFRDDPNRTIRNTFQVTLASNNGRNSFAIFYYNKIQWTTGDASGGANGLGGTPAQVGFDAGDGQHRDMLSVSCTADVLNIGTMSNAGKPGVFVYQTDGDHIATPAPVTQLTTQSTTKRLPPTTTSAPADPRSDAIGSPCSQDVSQAWLDIVFVLDVSKSVSTTSLTQLAGEIATFMSGFSFGQDGQHTTRVAIVTYATDAVAIYNLTDTTNIDDFTNVLLSVQASTNDAGGNLQGGLQTAWNLLQAQKSYRRQAVMLIAAVYDDDGFQDAGPTSSQIQGNGGTVLAVTFDTSDGVFNPKIATLASPGYAFNSTQDGIVESLPLALTQVNCFCPPKSRQFVVRNRNNVTAYADCLYGFGGETLPAIAEITCRPGVLASITSQAKLDFIADNVYPHDLVGKKKFTVGAFASDGVWKWHGYPNSTDYLLGSYPQWGQQPSPTDKYSYLWNFSGFNFTIMPGGNTALPYLCQSRACDASYHCDITKP